MHAVARVRDAFDEAGDADALLQHVHHLTDGGPLLMPVPGADAAAKFSNSSSEDGDGNTLDQRASREDRMAAARAPIAI